jgi:putative transposase
MTPRHPLTPITRISNRRLHGSIGMVPPAEYEQAHYAALKPEMQPT